MRRIKLFGTVVLVSLVLVACATLQQKYDSATEDEKARLQVSAMQSALNSAFDAGKIYVSAHPEKQGDWKTKVVPMFDMANKVLAGIIADGKTGKPLTVLGVTGRFMDKTVELRTILLGWGVTL